MGLSCSCEEWDGDGWYYEVKTKLLDRVHTKDGLKFDVEYFFPLATNKRKRCQSCRCLIDIGAECIEFPRYRSANEIEERIYRDVVAPLASHFLCADCGETYLNLVDLGYCVGLDENMQDLLAEYRDLHDTSATGA